MVTRNREIAIPVSKTLQRLVLPLLSLHCHFSAVKLLKWVLSLTGPKAIRVSSLVQLPLLPVQRALRPQWTESLF